MPTITSAGVGSGLDVNGLVEKLVAAEGEPVRTRLDRKEAELQAGLTALDTFKGAVSEFRNALGSLREPDTFGNVEVVSDNEEFLTAIASNDALPGEYEVEVVQLAQAQKLASDAFDSDVKPLGTGILTIQTGRYDAANNRFSSNPDFVPATIEISEANSSLRGISEAINKSDAGVYASVINDGSGYRLVLSSENEGNDNSIRILASDDDGNDTDLAGLSNLAYDLTVADGAGANLTETVAAQDAVVKVNGLKVSRSNNELDDVISGVILELQPGAEGTKTSVSVSLSTKSVITSIEKFVDSYNSLVDVTNDLTGYNPETREAGPLSGDASVRGVNNQIRRILAGNFSAVNSTYDSLFGIGIDTQRDGKLTIDNGKLRKAVEENLQDVVQLFAVAGSASDPLIKYRGASENTPAGAYDLVVEQMATSGKYVGNRFIQEPFELDNESNAFQLRVDGKLSGKINLPQRVYEDATDLADAMQEAINNDPQLAKEKVKVGVKAESGHIVIQSERTGEGSTVEITMVDPELSAYSGLSVGKGIAGENAQGSFNHRKAVGNGAFLEGEGTAEGLRVEILGGDVGDRGKVYFSNGIAAQLDKLIGSFESEDGFFEARKEGLNARIDDVTKQREQLARKLERSEKRYMSQFTSLDALLGKMRSTGEYLDRQLSALPGAHVNRKNG